MRFCYVISILDDYVDFHCCKIKNKSICYVLGFLQLVIAALSLGQHIHSWAAYHHIFLCHSNVSINANLSQLYLANDLIIFDYGFFNNILGTTECVANYLDGGYLRGLWCLQHTGAILLMYPALWWLEKYPILLTPALLIQSVYALGLAILTLATAPKTIQAIVRRLNGRLLLVMVIFYCGELANWIFTCSLWHHYWRLEDGKTAKKKMEKEMRLAARLQYEYDTVFRDDTYNDFGDEEFSDDEPQPVQV